MGYLPNTLKQWQQLTTLVAPARTGCVSYSIGGVVYIACGAIKDTYPMEFSKEIWRYNENDTWTQCADFPGVGRFGAKTRIIPGINKVELFGGINAATNIGYFGTCVGIWETTNGTTWTNTSQLLGSYGAAGVGFGKVGTTDVLIGGFSSSSSSQSAPFANSFQFASKSEANSTWTMAWLTDNDILIDSEYPFGFISGFAIQSHLNPTKMIIGGGFIKGTTNMGGDDNDSGTNRYSFTLEESDIYISMTKKAPYIPSVSYSLAESGAATGQRASYVIGGSQGHNTIGYAQKTVDEGTTWTELPLFYHVGHYYAKPACCCAGDILFAGFGGTNTVDGAAISPSNKFGLQFVAYADNAWYGYRDQRKRVV
jgi:hypothetical protein